MNPKLNEQDKDKFFADVLSLEKKPEIISDMFNEIAPRYDLMNDLMSGFTHKNTRKFALTLFTSSKNRKLKYLDLATGTGDFTFLIADESYPNKAEEIVGIDFSKGMLKFADVRAKKLGFQEKIQFRYGDILNLPFANNTFDVLTIGYAIRNVVDVQAALKEIYRVTKPGGTFLVVEATPSQNKFYSLLISFYFEKLVVNFSKFISSAPIGYKYFIKSVTNFFNGPQFATKLKKAGFKHVRYFPKILGSVTIFQGVKT